MDIHVEQGNIVEQSTDCVVVNLFEGATEPSGASGSLDAALDSAIRNLIGTGDFTGEAGSTALLYTHDAVASPRVLLVGLGPAEELNLHGIRKIGAVIASRLSELQGVNSFATVVHGAGAGNLDSAEAAQALVEGLQLALYRAPQYKREVKALTPATCTVVEYDAAKLDAVRAGVARGKIMAAAVSRTRDLVSEPANVLYPTEFASRAAAMADGVGLRCTVLGEDAMRELGMNIFLAVSQGSEREAQLVILEHTPVGTEEEEPLILVGKGVTFDTGGISIKPAAGMQLMKDDMGGAAVVVGAMEAIARLAIPKRVIGVAACVENMPDGRAYRPGDIFTGITGKSAEIISTDAEGRLILADTLGYVARYQPRAVVDLATLTGAVSVALGKLAAAVFANDDVLRDGLLTAADVSSERLWPMPLYEEYKEAIKSDMAEVKNSGGRMGGLGTSAKFLEHFTEGYPWAHLDIAGMTWADAAPNAFTPAGATGFGVRLLVDFVNAY